MGTARQWHRPVCRCPSLAARRVQNVAADISSTDLLLGDEPSSEYGDTVPGVLRQTPTVIVTMPLYLSMRRRYRIISIAHPTCLPVPSDVLTLPSDPFLDSLCRADGEKDGLVQLTNADHVTKYIPSYLLICGPAVTGIVPSAALMVRMSALQIAMRLLP